MQAWHPFQNGQTLFPTSPFILLILMFLCLKYYYCHRQQQVLSPVLFFNANRVVSHFSSNTFSKCASMILISLCIRCSGRWSCGVAVPGWRQPDFARADVSPGLVPPGPGLQCVSGPVEPGWAQRPGPRALAPFKTGPTQKAGGQSGVSPDPGRLDEGRRMGSSELGEKHSQERD